MDTNTIIILLIVGFFAGMLSGLVGIGGGIFIVPALAFFLGLSQHQAQGASLGVFLMPVGILAAYNYYKNGAFDFKYSLVIACTFVIGAYFGSKVAMRIDEQSLRRVFGVVVFLLSIKLIFGK